MTEPTGTAENSKYSKKPNFLLIVVLSCVALLVVMLCAYFLVGDKGKRLLPGLHQDPQPHSYLRQQLPGRPALRGVSYPG